MSATRAEVAVAACADLFADDGEVVASPMGLVPLLGARLARLTSNPDLLLSDGEALLVSDVPAFGQRPSAVEGWLPFRKVLDAVVPHGRRHVVMGANQIDRHGNQNISAIGDHAKPARQLLGVRGAPGNTVNHRTSYWVPRHSPRVFVPEVDVVAGVGRDRARRAGPAAERFHDVHRVVSDLGVFDFANGVMRLVATHPGVDVGQVQEQTGFPLDMAPAMGPATGSQTGPGSSGVSTTRTPDPEELRLIREVLDPGGERDGEVRA